MALCHIQGVFASLIRHQVLNLARTPHSKQTNLFVVTTNGTQAPKCIIQSVAV
jgi:hypothetical protein